MKNAIRAQVQGRVQGVGFRYWTRAQAQQLELSGWVRNESDGSVSAHFEGDDEELAEMTRSLWEGPRWSKVTNVTTSPASEQGYASFEITS